MTAGWDISWKIALRWMPLDLIDKSTLVQVTAWCVWQQAITWANVNPDLCRYMVSLGHNVLSNHGRIRVALKIHARVYEPVKTRDNTINVTFSFVSFHQLEVFIYWVIYSCCGSPQETSLHTTSFRIFSNVSAISKTFPLILNHFRNL